MSSRRWARSLYHSGRNAVNGPLFESFADLDWEWEVPGLEQTGAPSWARRSACSSDRSKVDLARHVSVNRGGREAAGRGGGDDKVRSNHDVSGGEHAGEIRTQRLRVRFDGAV